MQPFRLRKDARKWFKQLYDKKSFQIGFDCFYFCFVAGVTARRKTRIPQDETDELVAYFPDKYRSRGNLLVALFLKRELDTMGVGMADKKEVRSMVASLLTREGAQHHLSDSGVREFNKYAHAGFDVIFDWYRGDAPRTLEAFLLSFRRNVHKTLNT